MYLMITERCNMSCAHCCGDCTKKGKDMSWKVFKKACDVAMKSGADIFIGGGEPTLHPKFWEMLGYAITCFPYAETDSITGVITNGSITDSAIRLAEMARVGIIYAGLSQDEFHDPIASEVVRAFTKNKNRERVSDQDHREIRLGGNGGVIPAGRGKKLVDAGEYEVSSTCACAELFCSPNGDVRKCGCMDAPVIGNVMDDGFEINGETHECYRDGDIVPPEKVLESA